jgi:hypothetical protein
LEDEKHNDDRLFAERERWIDETMRTEPEPYLRVAAVLIPIED